jgi:hypothetical protein
MGTIDSTTVRILTWVCAQEEAKKPKRAKDISNFFMVIFGIPV